MANINRKNSFTKALSFVNLDHIPGPRAFDYFNYVRKFQSNILDAFTQTNLDFGNIASFPWPMNSVIIYAPEFIEEVLKTRAKDFEKGEQIGELRAVVGNGLATNNDMESWKRSRSVISKEFGPRAVKSYSKLFLDQSKKYMEQNFSTKSTTRDICHDMKMLTFNIACLSFLGKELSASDAIKVNDGVDFTSVVTYERIFKFFPLPYWLPTKTNIKFKKHYNNLKTIVMDIINDLRISQTNLKNNSILERLVFAKDDNGIGFSDSELLDEILTLILAGHETSAHTLAWTIGLLAQNEAFQERLFDEFLKIDSPLDVDLFEEIPLLKNVLNESMRLYPAFPVLSRKARVDTQIGPYKIPKDTNVVIPIYVTQRSPKYFNDELSFNPLRFMESQLEKSFTFLPFSRGQRKCVGELFAMREMSLILFELVSNYKFSLVDNQMPEDTAFVSLKPVGGMNIILEKR